MQEWFLFHNLAKAEPLLQASIFKYFSQAFPMNISFLLFPTVQFLLQQNAAFFFLQLLGSV